MALWHSARAAWWPCGDAVCETLSWATARRCDPTRGASVGVFGINQGLTCSSGLG